MVFNKNTNFDVQTLINRLKHIYMKQLLVVFGLLLMSATTYAQKNFSRQLKQSLIKRLINKLTRRKMK